MQNCMHLGPIKYLCRDYVGALDYTIGTCLEGFLDSRLKLMGVWFSGLGLRSGELRFCLFRPWACIPGVAEFAL